MHFSATSGEAALDDLLQARVDLFLVPAEVLEVLHPLEVGDDHAACVAEHVWCDVDALVAEDLVGLRCGRGVRALEQDLAVERVGVVLVDCSTERGRDQHVALGLEELLLRRLFRVRELGDVATLVEEELVQAMCVNSLVIRRYGPIDYKLCS